MEIWRAARLAGDGLRRIVAGPPVHREAVGDGPRGREHARRACAAGATGPDQRRRRERGLGDPGWGIAARSMGLA